MIVSPFEPKSRFAVALKSPIRGEDRPNMSESKLWYLKRCDLFERLSPEDAARLENRSSSRKFGKGEIVYLPGDPSVWVMVVARGRIKLKGLTADGRETILAFVEEGEVFGELAILDDAPRDEFAEAAMETEVVAVPRDEILRLLEERPDAALRMTKLVGLRRRRIETRLRNLLFRDSRHRVASLLLELLETHGERTGDEWRIGLPLSHQDLAGLVGATRESVTIALGRLQLDGFIRVRRRKITVLDRDRLTAEAE